MAWLKRWDQKNKQWAERTRQQQNEPSPPKGIGDRIVSGYVTYKLVTWAVVVLVAVIALIVQLIGRL